jgi:hypothetical protein
MVMVAAVAVVAMVVLEVGCFSWKALGAAQADKAQAKAGRAAGRRLCAPHFHPLPNSPFRILVLHSRRSLSTLLYPSLRPHLRAP